MSNKYFPDEQIDFNDLYFVCYMIERVARRLHQRNRYVVAKLGGKGLLHELSIAETNHCLNPAQVEDDWITTYGMAPGNFYITRVDSRFTDKVPSPTQMGKVCARLISSVDTEDNLPAAMAAVYSSPICYKIDDYNRDCREMPKRYSTN